MSDIVISAQDIGKLYQLGEIGTGTISHDLNRWYARVRGKDDPFAKVGEVNDRTIQGISNYVWALKNIDFDVKKGEVLGIIGRNGAGKSTLLKILSKVTSPTTGTIKVRGRIASLLEVGTGFHPELTGRENVFLNGAILGMTRKEIKRKFDEIVDFAGVERYIDTPVKRYSSGMYVRLAFAVAAFLEPEILIVDEVLAVGDAEFQKKCLGRMKDVSVNEGRTVLFVSHNMSAVSVLCTKGLLLTNGLVEYHGLIPAVIEAYMQHGSNENNFEDVANDHIGNDEVHLKSIKILDEKCESNCSFFSDMPILIEVGYNIKKPSKNLRFIASIKSQEGIVIFETADTVSLDSNIRQAGSYTSQLCIPPDLFNIGKYYVEVVCDKPSEQQVFGPFEIPFTITELMNSQIGVFHSGKPEGILHPKLSWKIKKNVTANV